MSSPQIALLQPQTGLASAPELACLWGRLPATLLEASAQRAAVLKTGADCVLIAWGVISEAVYLDCLASYLGVQLETFAKLTQADCLLADGDIVRGLERGILPMRIGRDLVWIVALQNLTARGLCRSAAAGRSNPNLRLTLSRDLSDFALFGIDAVTRYATCDLRSKYAPLSAAPHDGTIARLTAAIRACAVGMFLTVIVAALPLSVIGDGLAIVFIAGTLLRTGAAFISPRGDAAPERSDAVPIYSVVVALYREDRSVPALLAALDALDYPKERLDIMLMVESDDLPTRAAIARRRPGPHVRTILAPRDGPRTKPKALNAALPFARGEFIVVFDAEDSPEPDQLRIALAAFRRGGKNLAVLQGRLTIDNADDNLLTRTFAAEYSGQFDCVMPGLSRFGLPFPLGGTSNHIRLAALRRIGAWDAYNVTEDADLGVWFVRFGYRMEMIASRTFEEAPLSPIAWIKQRSRWMKGWLQTIAVHLRRPGDLARDSGWRGIFLVILMLGVGAGTALAYPLFLVMLGAAVCHRYFGIGEPIVLTSLHLLSIGIGLGGSMCVWALGMIKRRRWRDLPLLLLTPVHWLGLSIAAWRAVVQLVVQPSHWEKTEHGVARNRVRPTAYK